MPFQFRKEAIEEDLNSNFPSQGQGNPPLYYSLSETVVPTYSINQVAEGSSLPTFLQTAWDFSTGNAVFGASTGSTTLISNTGFWKVDVIFAGATSLSGAVALTADIDIFDGLTSKPVWGLQSVVNQTSQSQTVENQEFYVFLRSGDSLRGTIGGLSGFCTVSVVYRQVADVNGNLVNPLGFSFA